MASLRAFLPSAGGTVWRNDRRRSTRTSSSGDGEHGLSITRIKHIVIREVWKKTIPSPHALYKIDVMTQSNHWVILRRYREFHSLHQNLVKQYGVPKDMLPAKTISSTLALDHLENRRNALEHYLQRLINSHHDIAESKELFEFLKVETHDVLCVTRQLSKVLEKQGGRDILSSGSMFTFTPTQMYCITRQLQLPHCAVETPVSSNEDEEFMDLGYLYSFIQELKSLCVNGLGSKSSPCEELISNQAFDISLFKSLEKLEIDKCHISVIDGLFRIQKQLTHVTVRTSIKTMKEFLVDCAMEKRQVNQVNSNAESWRNFSTTKLTENRIVVCPWFLLTHLNLSHNNIVTLDHSLQLLPALEQLDLSFNDFSHLDLNQLTSSTLTLLNVSHNNIHYISSSKKDLLNLKSLLLSHNKLQSLDGLDSLRGLVELDIRNNEIKRVDELAKISSLLHLRILALTGNPCVASKSYRINVFYKMKARELILDGIKINDIEKKKVQQEQERKTKEFLPEVAEDTTHYLHKNIVEVDRDDDQDSGFGGNFAGSIDDGGLVFDWGCFRDTGMPSSSASSQSRAGPSGVYQGPKSGNILNREGSNLVVTRIPETPVSILESHRVNGKGKAPLRGRPENRKNNCKSPTRTEIEEEPLKNLSRTKTVESISEENNSKYLGGLSTRIAPIQEYNPFLDNTLVLPEQNETRFEVKTDDVDTWVVSADKDVVVGDSEGRVHSSQISEDVGGALGCMDNDGQSNRASQNNEVHVECVNSGDDSCLRSVDNGTTECIVGDGQRSNLTSEGKGTPRDGVNSRDNSSLRSADDGTTECMVGDDQSSNPISEDKGTSLDGVNCGNDSNGLQSRDNGETLGCRGSDDQSNPAPEDNGTCAESVNGGDGSTLPSRELESSLRCRDSPSEDNGMDVDGGDSSLRSADLNDSSLPCADFSTTVRCVDGDGQSNPALEDNGTDVEGMNFVDDISGRFTDNGTCHVSEDIGTSGECCDGDVNASALSIKHTGTTECKDNNDHSREFSSDNDVLLHEVGCVGSGACCGSSVDRDVLVEDKNSDCCNSLSPDNGVVVAINANATSCSRSPNNAMDDEDNDVDDYIL